MPFWRSMFRRKRRKAVARNFQAARHDATKLTKALPERAPPTSKGCRRLAASSRLAEHCSAVSSCDSALPAHYGSGLASGIGHVKASDPQACREARAGGIQRPRIEIDMQALVCGDLGRQVGGTPERAGR